MLRTMLRSLLAITVGAAGWPVVSQAEDHFRNHVMPILQARCLGCHNDADREGDFSLQTGPAAFAGGYIEPGDADSSYLLELITPVAGHAEMPQNATPLSDEEIAAIRHWIDEGADWPAGLALNKPELADFDWWSCQPVTRPDLPDCQDDPWVRTPIDAFVLERLRDQGLTPSEEADRRTLIRRLTFDLHGLPPDPADVEAFVNDPDPRAWEKRVDRLLASRHYGERWARHWLDVVQYADTCGYDKDKLRPHAWPYRDYVIRSLNQDKPWGRFVQEQVAGDVLFPNEPDGIIGLGFVAAGPWDFIGHVEVPESKIDGKVARNLDRDNMVTNTFNAFCSMTVQCARCHDHKFDPISQEHYYGLQAVFAAVDRADRLFDTDPQVAWRRRQLDRELAQLLARQEELAAEIAAAGGETLRELNRQIARLQELASDRGVQKDPQFGYHSQLAAAADTTKWVQLELAGAIALKTVVLHPCHDEFAGIGAGFGFPVRFQVQVSADGKDWQTVLDQTQTDYANPGLAPLVIEPALQQPTSHVRIQATRLAERSGDYLLALAEVEVFDATGKNVAPRATVTALDSIEMPDRWSRRNLVDGRWPRWHTASQNSGEHGAANRPADDSPGDPARSLPNLIGQRDRLLAGLETPDRGQRREAIGRSLESVRSALAALPERQRVYAATTDFPPQGSFQPTRGQPRPVFVLKRGEVRKPGPPAPPGLLPLTRHDRDVALDASLSETQRRATLARWLTSRQHPLVWRSIVNRVWLYHFGEGLVATPNDFGRMGALPTHPELLDWLAVEFRDGGQSLKQLHRLIVTSSVYRQSSRTRADHAAIDAGNRYWWRMNRRRLTAEEIRDSILAVSGVLDRRMGGPGYYLFALEKTEHSPHYQYHKFDPSDPATHRRSIYRFVVRSQPDPWMTTLDCADSSQSTPKRSETLTALQALSLLNSKFNLEMARQFAARLQTGADDTDRQVRQAMRLLVQRWPDDTEQAELAAFARSHGLTSLCRVLFNLSEFVYID